MEGNEYYKNIEKSYKYYNNYRNYNNYKSIN